MSRRWGLLGAECGNGCICCCIANNRAHRFNLGYLLLDVVWCFSHWEFSISGLELLVRAATSTCASAGMLAW